MQNTKDKFVGYTTCGELDSPEQVQVTQIEVRPTDYLGPVKSIGLADNMDQLCKLLETSNRFRALVDNEPG